MKKWIQLSFDFKPLDDEEIWKDVINNKYELSNLGNLVHKKTKKAVKGCLHNNGYIYDGFRIEGKIITKARHRLMWETFVGEIPKGMQINHINEIKTDNRLENLNLMTCKENNNWGTRNERSAKAQTNSPKRSKSVIQKSLDGKVIAIWPSINEIERQLGYSHTNIGKCCNGGYFDKRTNKWVKAKHRYGFIWEYTTKEATFTSNLFQAT